MRHPDADTLALLALGEDDGDGAAEHLRTCAVCRKELESLRAVVGHARAAEPLQQPPAALWDRIAAEIGTEASSETGTGTGALTSAETGSEPGPVAGSATGTDTATGTSVARPGAPGSATRPAGARAARPVAPRGTQWLAWALVASFVVGVAGTLLGQSLLSRAQTEVLATAELDPLPGWSADGAARVEERDGRRVLTVRVDETDVDGYREVWLLDAAVERLVSVGVLTAEEGQFDLPAELDLAEFVVVDVSREPYDGDPAHSGDSIVRGELF